MLVQWGHDCHGFVSDCKLRSLFVQIPFNASGQPAQVIIISPGLSGHWAQYPVGTCQHSC